MAFRRWIWVEDTQTKHRFDVDERQVDRLVAEGSVRIVEGYPVNEGPNVGPRQAKHHVDLGGETTPPGPAAVETTGTPSPTPAPPRRLSTRSATAASTAATTSAEGADK